MNLLAQRGIRELQGKGICLDPAADLDIILDIIRMAAKVTTPGAGTMAHLSPVLKVGNVTLHQLSIGAAAFMEDHVRGWLEDRPVQYALAMAYVMAHADQPQMLWNMQGDCKGFLAGLKAWKRTVGVSTGTLLDCLDTFLEAGAGDHAGQLQSDEGRAFEVVLAQLKTEEQDGDEVDEARQTGWLFDILVSQYGHSIHYWTWEAPIADVATLLDAYLVRQESEQKRQEQLAGQGSGGPSAHDPYVKTLKDWRLFIAHLGENLKGRRQDA